MTTELFCRMLVEGCGIAPGAHVLAAVSGGADSVALLCLLCAARETLHIRVSAAHVEHGIRGQASSEDMAFVCDLCREMRVQFVARQVDAPALAAQKGCGLEAAARELRYAALHDMQQETGADVIALAHHSGDQAETVLMHAARGSDLRGLCGMRMRRGVLIRPLLGATRAQLIAYLQKNHQPWREDETNADAAYARNRVRREVLPSLERAYPGASDAFARLALCAQRDEDFFAQQIRALEIPLIPLADGAAVETKRLRNLHDALLSRVLVYLLEAAGAQASGLVVDRLMHAVRRGETSAAVGIGSVDGQTVQARLGERYLCVTRPYAEIPQTPLLPEGETNTPFGTFIIRKALPGETGDGVTCQVVPMRLLSGAAVTVRREGDIIVPFGHRQAVKVKKLLIDCGVERAMRRSIPVIRHGGDILWLAGIRPAESCRAEENEERRMIVFRPAECVNIQKED